MPHATRTSSNSKKPLVVCHHCGDAPKLRQFLSVRNQARDLSAMTCHELAQRLVELQPELEPVDVARISLMILTQHDGTIDLKDDAHLMSAWKNATFRLEAASDQHAAVADELNSMCDGGPVEFSPDQLWILLRAVKVQSQILELYTNQPSLA